MQSISVSYTKVCSLPIRGYPKPRMTRQDSWSKPPPAYRKPGKNGKIPDWPRPCVQKYRKFERELLAIVKSRQLDFDIRLPYLLVFKFKTKVKNLWGKPHQVKPDKDNLEKAFLDILYQQDQAAWNGCVVKLWDAHDVVEIWQGTKDQWLS